VSSTNSNIVTFDVAEDMLSLTKENLMTTTTWKRYHVGRGRFDVGLALAFVNDSRKTIDEIFMAYYFLHDNKSVYRFGRYMVANGLYKHENQFAAIVASLPPQRLTIRGHTSRKSVVGLFRRFIADNDMEDEYAKWVYNMYGF